MLVNLATELSISDLKLSFGCSWNPLLRDCVRSFSHFFQSTALVLHLLLLMFTVCWAKLISIPLWHVDIRSSFFVWHLILLFLVRTRSQMLEPFEWVNVLISPLWTSSLCLLMILAKISLFLLVFLCCGPHAGCLALKSPNMIRGVCVWYLGDVDKMFWASLASGFWPLGFYFLPLSPLHRRHINTNISWSSNANYQGSHLLDISIKIVHSYFFWCSCSVGNTTMVSPFSPLWK